MSNDKKMFTQVHAQQNFAVVIQHLLLPQPPLGIDLETPAILLSTLTPSSELTLYNNSQPVSLQSNFQRRLNCNAMKSTTPGKQPGRFVCKTRTCRTNTLRQVITVSNATNVHSEDRSMAYSYVPYNPCTGLVYHSQQIYMWPLPQLSNSKAT